MHNNAARASLGLMKKCKRCMRERAAVCWGILVLSAFPKHLRVICCCVCEAGGIRVGRRLRVLPLWERQKNVPIEVSSTPLWWGEINTDTLTQPTWHLSDLSEDVDSVFSNSFYTVTVFTYTSYYSLHRKAKWEFLILNHGTFYCTKNSCLNDCSDVAWYHHCHVSTGITK